MTIDFWQIKEFNKKVSNVNLNSGAYKQRPGHTQFHTFTDFQLADDPDAAPQKSLMQPSAPECIFQDHTIQHAIDTMVVLSPYSDNSVCCSSVQSPTTEPEEGGDHCERGHPPPHPRTAPATSLEPDGGDFLESLLLFSPYARPSPRSTGGPELPRPLCWSSDGDGGRHPAPIDAAPPPPAAAVDLSAVDPFHFDWPHW